MEPRNFFNKDLQFLKNFAVLLAALPLCMLFYLAITPELDNRAEVLKLFAVISGVLLLLIALAWKRLAALPPYYLQLKNAHVIIPLSSFLGWNGEQLELPASAVKEVIHDTKASGSGSNLVIVFPAGTVKQERNMALGHMRFEKVKNGIALVICGVKKKDAQEWQQLLSPSKTAR